MAQDLAEAVFYKDFYDAAVSFEDPYFSLKSIVEFHISSTAAFHNKRRMSNLPEI